MTTQKKTNLELIKEKIASQSPRDSVVSKIVSTQAGVAEKKEKLEMIIKNFRVSRELARDFALYCKLCKPSKTATAAIIEFMQQKVNENADKITQLKQYLSDNQD